MKDKTDPKLAQARDLIRDIIVELEIKQPGFGGRVQNLRLKLEKLVETVEPSKPKEVK